MQITHIHCALKTEFVWGKKKKHHQLKKVISREYWQYFQDYNFIFRWLFWSIHIDDLSTHQVFLTENPWGPPHHLGGCLQIGDFFWTSHTVTFLSQLMWKFRGGGKSPNQKKKKKRDREREERGWGVRSVHDNNYLCPFGFCSFHVMELFSCGCPGNCSGRSEYLLLKEVCDWGPSDTTFCCIEVFDPLSLSSKTNPILLKNG